LSNLLLIFIGNLGFALIVLFDIALFPSYEAAVIGLLFAIVTFYHYLLFGIEEVAVLLNFPASSV
jgi:hypothetical protein